MWGRNGVTPPLGEKHEGRKMEIFGGGRFAARARAVGNGPYD